MTTTYETDTKEVFPLQPILDYLVRFKPGIEFKDPEEIAIQLGVRPGLIRKAIKSGLDAFECDLLCTRGLACSPAAVYGMEAWWGPVGGLREMEYRALREMETVEAERAVAARAERLAALPPSRRARYKDPESLLTKYGLPDTVAS